MTHLKKRVASQKILQFLQNNKVIFFFQKKSVQSDHWRLLKKKIAKIEGVASLNMKNKRDKKEIQPLILSHFTPQESLITSSNFPGDTPDSPSASCSTNLVQVKDLQREGKGREPAILTAKRFCTESVSTDQTTYPKPSGPLPPCFLHSQKHEDKINGAQRLENEGRLEMAERICGLLYAPNLILGSDSLKKLAHLSFQLKEDSNLIFIGGWDGNGVINHLDSLKLLETPQDIWKDGVSCLSSSYARPYFFLYSLLEKRRSFLVYSLKEKIRALTRSLQEIRK